MLAAIEFVSAAELMMAAEFTEVETVATKLGVPPKLLHIY